MPCNKTINLLFRLNKVFTSCCLKNYSSSRQEPVAVSSTAIKKLLKSNNVHFKDGYTCFITECPVCLRSDKSKVPNFYINKTTGMFMCVSCKKSGVWESVETYLQKSTTKKAKASPNANEKNEILHKCLQDVQNLTEKLSSRKDDLDHLLHRFKLPAISADCLTKLDVRIDKSGETLYFPLENVNSEIVGYRKLSSSMNSNVVPSVDFGGLLTVPGSKNKDTGILVPSISDFLRVLDSNLSHSLICLPNSVQSLPQIYLPSLEKYSKIILWLGSDVNSWDVASDFSRKLGEQRCYVARSIEKCPEAKDSPKEFIKLTIDGAKPFRHKFLTTFSNLRQDVLTELQNIDKFEGVKWKRFPALNKLLRGHRRGELTVVTGPTGCGKTTFISEYSLDLAMQNVNTLWGSFEIKNCRLAKIMLQQFSAVPLEENLHLFHQYADQFEHLPIHFMTFHGQQSIKTVMEAVEHATYVHDIAHVIVDNLQFMMGMTDSEKYIDRFWKQDLIIASFRTFATRANCHVTLVIHPRKERVDDDLTAASIFGGAKASQEADNVLILQDKSLLASKGKKYLQVVKNRYSGDLGVMPLTFDKSTLSFAKKTVSTKATKIND